MSTTKINYRKQFWFSALFMGVFMFLIMELLIPYAEHEPITQRGLLRGALVWGIFGLANGAFQVWQLRRSTQKEEE